MQKRKKLNDNLLWAPDAKRRDATRRCCRRQRRRQQQQRQSGYSRALARSRCALFGFVCSSSPLCFALYFTTRCCMVHISLILITNAFLSTICFNFSRCYDSEASDTCVIANILASALHASLAWARISFLFLFFFSFLWWSLLTKLSALSSTYSA